ncbi:MAG: ABC transporter permease [Gemmatimonadota bacterium]
MVRLPQDLRFAFRSFRRSPGLLAVAVLSLALGIGANTTIFSAVDVFMLRPLPYDHAGDLVQIWATSPERGWNRASMSPLDIQDFRRESQTLDIAAYNARSFNLSGTDRPERLRSLRVMDNFFRVLRASPAMGRTFLPDEEQPGHGHVAVLSYGLWQRRFGGDPGILDRTIRLNGEPYTVVGVMPKKFRVVGETVDLWTPLVFDGTEQRGWHYLRAVGRLQPGKTLDAARREMSALAARLEAAFPDSNHGIGVSLVSLHHQLYDETFRTATAIAMTSVVFVLLIACANVANLLLARASSRARELAVRTAMGAGRLRIVRQILTESLAIAAGGGLLGLALSVAGIRGLRAIMPAWFPRVEEVALDGRVFVFTLLVTGLAGVLFGLAPALQSARVDLRDTLTEGGRGGSAGRRRGRLRRSLVVAEMALALVLLISAGLLVRGFTKLRNVDLGFTTEHVLTFSVALPSSRDPDREKASQFYRDAQARLAAIPGVEAVGATTVLPFQGNNSAYYAIVGQPAPEAGRQPIVSIRSVLPGYFAAMGIGVARGRVFNARDDANGRPVALINEAMLRRHWPDGGAIGHQVHMGDTDYEIVGVVHDTRDFGPDSDAPALVYTPALQQQTGGMSFVLRFRGDPTTIAAGVRAQILAIDPDEPVFAVHTMGELLKQETGGNTIMAKLLAIFGLIALALAVVGVYGVMAYNVSQRTHEIGIRGALGAGRRDIVRMVLRQGAFIAGIGSLIGLLLAVAVTRTLSAFLFGISAFDPVTFAGVTLVLCFAAALASYIPARRAAAVDPMIALRDV